ncbi:MAG: ABC transporter substrate-binding protein [Candidatus Omnitrophota bacterium]
MFKFKVCVIMGLVLVCLIFSVKIVAAAQDTVTIGLNCPLTGSYQDQGEDELRAYKIAIEEVNKKGGILGKEVVYISKDSETNAALSGKNAEELYDVHGAVMVTGGSASSEAIAQIKVAGERKKIYMCALSHSNATTGFEGSKQEINRYGFRWFNNAHQSAKAMASALLDKYGKQAKYFYITADYTWGWSVEKSTREVLEAAGTTTVGTVLAPLGEKSFVKYLLKAKQAQPDVLVLAEFGKDMVNCLQQAGAMGLSADMKIVVPLMELNMAKGAGAKYMEGVLCSSIWEWQLEDKYPGSKEFVTKFKERYSRYPGSAAASAWVAIFAYADAVERAGTFEAEKVALALEDHKFTLLKDEEYFKGFDHQAVTSCVVLQGKAPDQMKNEWDFFDILAIVPGEKIAMTKSENPVVWKEDFK